MAYEYEKENKEAVMINPPKANRELKEVYRKAEAFNEIIELTKTEFVSEDLADSIRILVNDYEFDLEDK